MVRLTHGDVSTSADFGGETGKGNKDRDAAASP